MANARLFVVAVAGLVTVTACGGASQEGEPASRSAPRSATDYPIVTEADVAHTADGHPVPPRSYSAEPSASCERRPYKSAAGPGYFVAPPRPGLTAKALGERTVELRWSFRSLPPDCRPTLVKVGIVATYADAGAVTKFVNVKGLTGSVQLRYYDFLPPPNVALANSLTQGTLSGKTRKLWFQSRNARILIRR
jgi:hypothetical protein